MLKNTSFLSPIAMKKISENVFCVEEPHGRICSKVYVLEGEESVWLIDSGDKAERVLSNLKKPIERVLLTHGHFDHVLGAIEGKWDSWLRQEDLELITEMSRDYAEVPKPDFFKPFPPKLEFESFKLELFHTPGHTPGSVCFLDRKRGILFSGDTLFAGGFQGRTDLIGSDQGQMDRSLEKIASLEFDLLCPGHGKIEKRARLENEQQGKR
ncbi:MBL fold metallo-hydrolase [Candidatus Micrarchaeota archaeon]|nr:MBL fold metallo-hydrolase [Candidatus Micrarchaeota archaeon]